MNSSVIAIHQPNYIPWQGFFYKMLKSDIIVFLDNVQYSKNGIINRNRIRTPNGAMWLTVPVITKHSSGQMISEVRIDRTSRWRKKHLNSLRQFYEKTPFFNDYESELEEIYDKEWDRLIDINRRTIEFIAKSLGIEIKTINASSLDVKGDGTERLVRICRELGAGVYLSGESGKGYMEIDRFKEAGIELRFTDFRQPEYKQMYDMFLPNLSALDILFNCGKKSRWILEGVWRNEQ